MREGGLSGCPWSYPRGHLGASRAVFGGRRPEQARTYKPCKNLDASRIPTRPPRNDAQASWGNEGSVGAEQGTAEPSEGGMRRRRMLDEWMDEGAWRIMMDRRARPQEAPIAGARYGIPSVPFPPR
eukprot:9490613-Pyramimonas_sp.AAC.1